jgi:surface protein
MSGAFRGCTNLNLTATDIPVLSGVTDMSFMFYDCKNLNPTGAAAAALNHWHTDAVTNMEGMFWGATSFNQDIGNWNTANVINMYAMFQNATSFNQDIGNWNTANVIDMNAMFRGAAAFNQNLGNWKITMSPNMRYMLDDCGLSVTNYDKTLTGWARQVPSANRVLGAQGLKYCAAADARSKLISAYGWDITGDLLSCPLKPKMFPNPTKGPVRIINIKTGDMVVLTDAIGRHLLKQLATDESEMLDINLMAQGVYLISIYRKNEIILTDKITKLN